ncbi:three-Cys-motif partner protein TcmP [Aldersonia sp. NBC_00410]|uniref:three-Cys-motif partner protein TcmP n=1 Tax=Aldersonia sp. NBC_00410 TaxID=2975954 RepID=UPI0022559492|nr:three-Cys-motif partner protein TcmP [Aldersonia sp. NBC_00410]MCX5042453.1 three-Cys-motif partner protein TcmP [Aldersonia sp. NBC_00410]
MAILVDTLHLDGRSAEVTRREDLRSQTDYKSDPHTRLKHAFYRRYIACWMGKVLQGRWAKPGTIIDGFAGSGMYSDGLDGSAIMTAKLFREHICRPNFQPLTYVTNDLDPRRCEALDGRMKGLPLDDGIQHVPVGPKKFEDIVGEVRQKHAPRGKQALWIIDPYGLKQIPWSIVSETVTVPKNDAVITFMADEAHRYRTNPAMVSVMGSLYGDDSWKNVPDRLTTAQSKAALVKLYCDKLEALGCHTSSFDVDVARRYTRYSLIFATHHQAGLECWNSAKWSADPTSGRGASAATAFQPSLLEPDIQPLIDDFRKRIGVHDFTALVSRAQILGHTEPHVRTALDELFREGLVVRLSPATAPKNSPWPATCRIRIFEAGPDEGEDGGAS